MVHTGVPAPPALPASHLPSTRPANPSSQTPPSFSRPLASSAPEQQHTDRPVHISTSARLLNRLNAVFLSVIPSLIFGFLGLMLDEAARLFDCAARILHRAAAARATREARAQECNCADRESANKELLVDEPNALRVGPQVVAQVSRNDVVEERTNALATDAEDIPGIVQMESIDEENIHMLSSSEEEDSIPMEEGLRDGSSTGSTEPECNDYFHDNDILEHDSDAPGDEEPLVVPKIMTGGSSVRREPLKDDSYIRATSTVEDEDRPSIAEVCLPCPSPSEVPKCVTAEIAQKSAMPFENIPPPPPYDPPVIAHKPRTADTEEPQQMNCPPREANSRDSLDQTVQSTGVRTIPERPDHLVPASDACSSSSTEGERAVEQQISTTVMSGTNDQAVTSPSSASSILDNDTHATTSPGNMSVISDATDGLDQVNLSDATYPSPPSPTKTAMVGKHGPSITGTARTSSMVNKRVSEYEDFLATTEAEINTSIKLPLPESPVLSSTHASEVAAISPTKDIILSKLHSTLPNVEAAQQSLCGMRSSRSDGRLIVSLAGEAPCPQEGKEIRSTSTGCPIRRESVAKKQLHENESREGSYSEVASSSSKSKAVSQFDVTDAPLGVESLQELIPEVLPGVGRNLPVSLPQSFADTTPDRDPALFPEYTIDDMPEIMLDDDTIIRVESMEKLPSFSLSRQGSLASLHTESYSSPKSPSNKSPVQAGLQSKHRESWRASDHDLFSEDPMMECENVEESIRSNSKSRDASKELGTAIDGARFENSLVEDYDSAKMIVGVRRAESRRRASSESEEGEVHAATPFAKPSDRSSWQRRSEEIDSVQSQRPVVNAQSGTPTPEGAVRQEILNATTLSNATTFSSSTLTDRERSRGREKSLIPRFTPSQMSSKLFLTPVSGQPLPSSKVGRSVSASDGHYEDWPEFKPSLGDAAAQGRRHRSDMSVGANARKRDLLPFELLHAHTLNERSPDVDPDVPMRFRSTRRRWLRIFGRSAAAREENDVRGAVKNILRIGKRPMITAETPEDKRTESAHRSPFEKANRRSASGACDFRFEIEIGQDAVFSLLCRICQECGFNVVVRKPLFKLKVEIPCDGGRGPMLVSIQLSRSSQGKGTFISMVRSKDDQSNGPPRDVEAAGVLLRKRLGSHVEFIDDSFPELYMQDSAVNFGAPGVGPGS